MSAAEMVTAAPVSLEQAMMAHGHPARRRLFDFDSALDDDQTTREDLPVTDRDDWSPGWFPTATSQLGLPTWAYNPPEALAAQRG